MRSFTVKINGKTYNAEIEETTAGATAAPAAAPRAAAPAPKAAAPAPAPAAAPKPAGGATGGTASPMPGTILKVCVTNGATVNAGDTIIILEAMKMENEIVAAASGTVSINVAVGQSVNTGDSLFVIS